MNGPILRHLGAGERWVLVEAYDYPLEDCTVRLPAGFVTDLASVPDLLHWLIDEVELGTAGPILHDAIYQHRGELPVDWCYPYRTFTRQEADVLLVSFARIEGCPRWRCKLALWAVRVFGRPAWG